MRPRVRVWLMVLSRVASAASAQRIRGQLTDSATGQPIGGALVTLNDGKGAFLSHAISDPSGQFFAMRLAATRSMRIVRIGFRPRDVVVGADSVVDLRMQPIAPILPAVATRAKRVCKRGPQGDAALELWEQARTALRASVIARDVSPLTVHLHRFPRTYDAVERHMLTDSSEYDDLTVDRSFVAARTPIAFAQQGYLREYLNGNREYYAPDEAVLIDPTFVEQHCLWRVDGNDAHASQVGISFAPIADAAHDTLGDIAGTLWLDRERPQLRELGFR